MKKLFLLITVFALQASAKESVQEINDTVLLPISNGLRCILEAGQPKTKRQMYTEYQPKYLGQDHLEIRGTIGDAMELTHTAAYQSGCDIDKLDKVVDDSFQHFGFKIAQIKLIKQSEASFINGFNECVAHYKETLKITLAPGVELASEESELRKMNDCTTK